MQHAAWLAQEVDELSRKRVLAREDAEAIPSLQFYRGFCGGVDPSRVADESMRRSIQREALLSTLESAVSLITPSYRQEAARILLGLDSDGSLAFTDKVDRVEDLYKRYDAPGPQPARHHRQVLMRAEVPAVRDAVVSALIACETDFSAARTRGSRSSHRRASVSWEQYQQLTATVIDKVKALRPPAAPMPPGGWVVVGVGTAGLPLATELASALETPLVGAVFAWDYAPRAGDLPPRTVLEGFHLPAAEPTIVVVAHDVVSDPGTLGAVQRPIREFYGSRPFVVEASLLRDNTSAPPAYVPHACYAQEVRPGAALPRWPWEPAQKSAHVVPDRGRLLEALRHVAPKGLAP